MQINYYKKSQAAIFVEARINFSFTITIDIFTESFYFCLNKIESDSMKVRMGKRGVIVVPKIVRERLGLKEGMVLELEVRGDELVLKARDLWAELRARGEDTKFDVDMLERELDEDEDKWLERRVEKLL